MKKSLEIIYLIFVAISPVFALLITLFYIRGLYTTEFYSTIMVINSFFLIGFFKTMFIQKRNEFILDQNIKEHFEKQKEVALKEGV